MEVGGGMREREGRGKGLDAENYVKKNVGN